MTVFPFQIHFTTLLFSIDEFRYIDIKATNTGLKSSILFWVCDSLFWIPLILLLTTDYLNTFLNYVLAYLLCLNVYFYSFSFSSVLIIYIHYLWHFYGTDVYYFECGVETLHYLWCMDVLLGPPKFYMPSHPGSQSN